MNGYLTEFLVWIVALGLMLAADATRAWARRTFLLMAIIMIALNAFGVLAMFNVR